MKKITWVLIGIGIFLYLFSHPEISLFSIQDFKEKYGPLIELSDTSDPNFGVNNVIGGIVTFSVPACYPEDSTAPTTRVILNGIQIASGSSPQTCEQDIFGGGTGDPDETITITETFEIDSSFLSLPLIVSGADTISYYIKVGCTYGSDCIDPIRGLAFVCDLSDYKCKNPSLVQEGYIAPDKPEDEKTFNFVPLIIIGLILAALGLFGGKALRGLKK